MSNDAAGFALATDRSVASPIGAYDAGLRPGPFPDQTASLLPGSLATTRTGLTPAGDDELLQVMTAGQSPPDALDARDIEQLRSVAAVVASSPACCRDRSSAHPASHPWHGSIGPAGWPVR